MEGLHDESGTPPNPQRISVCRFSALFKGRPSRTSPKTASLPGSHFTAPGQPTSHTLSEPESRLSQREPTSSWPTLASTLVW